MASGQHYESEEAFVNSFCSLLNSGGSPWGNLRYAREFNYIRGKTDLVALRNNTEVLAFEFKLVKWRVALVQAYRNTCFSHYSYMVLPEKVAFRALSHDVDLNLRAVGVCSIQDGKIKVLHRACRTDPIQPRLSSRAIETAGGGSLHESPEP